MKKLSLLLAGAVLMTGLSTGAHALTLTLSDGVTFDASATAAPVPEPGTMVLLGVGLLGIAIYSKRRMNKDA